MGSTTSRAKFDSDVDKAQTISDCNRLWHLYVASRKTAVTGGALDDYVSEGRIAAKGEIVAKLADALRAANIKIPETSDDEKLATNIIAALPDPRGRKRFPADAKKQAAICRKLAKVLNEQFTPGASGSRALIDLESSPEQLCTQVYGVASSLRNAATAEFLTVYADVRLTYKKIQIMRGVMKKAYGHLAKVAIERAEGSEGAKTQAYDAQYRAVDQMLDQYLVQLKNYISAVIEPAEADIVELVKNDEQFKEELDRLNLQLGSPEFGKGLQYRLYALGNSALMTAKLDKALKAVGMSSSDFKRLSSNDELDAALERLQDKRKSDVSLGDFLSAAQMIRGYRDKVPESVEGGCACGGDSDDDGMGSADFDDLPDEDHVEFGEHVSGGADADPFGEDQLDKRIKRMKEQKRLVLTSFNRRVRKSFDALLEAVAALGPQLGVKIPLGSRTEALRDALLRIETGEALEMKEIYFALSGYIRDPSAREKKELFLADLRMIRSVLTELMGAAGYGEGRKYLEPMAAAIDSLIQTIVSFSEEVEKKYRGRGEIPGVEGGDDDTQLPNIARSAIDLKKAINDFQYFYYVAGIKDNLKQTHKELEAYGEGYGAKLADAIGAQRNKVREANKALKEAVNLTDAHKYIDRIDECRDEFWRAIEAVDLYLKEFTEAITANPDDVKSIAGMLDDTVVIAKWFREETGDNICRAFECMPTDSGAPSQVLSDDADQAKVGQHDKKPNPHYYEDGEVKAGRVGQADKMLDLTNEDHRKRADQAQAYLDKALNNFQALKNVMSVVTTIGDKIGRGFSERMLMSPAQIYDKFLAFLKCSAFVVKNEGGAKFGFSRFIVGEQPGSPFQSEYLAFARALKALAAKVLTVLGVFDMFEKPGRLREIGPVRLITGGADYGPPQVIPDAAELYLRLTLLAEFYKDIFTFDNTQNAKDRQISMIPEVEGIFSGLIYIIFEKASYGSTSGAYTPDDLASLVREINAIYRHFSGSGKDVTKRAIDAFIAEINRRYGIIKREQWTKWVDLRAKMRNLGRFDGSLGDGSNDIEILRGEGSTNRRAVGSDRYVGLTGSDAGAPGTYKSKYDIGDEPATGSRALIVELMDKVYEKVKSPSNQAELVQSYTRQIARAREEMRSASTDEKKFDVVRSLIQGSGNFTRPSSSSLVMFHETVVVGLNVLIQLYNVAKKFVDDVNAINTNNKAAAMQQLIQAVYSVSCCEGVRVDVRYPKRADQLVFLDFGGLKNTASLVLNAIKSMMDRMRPALDKDTIAMFERSSDGNDVKTIYDLDGAFDTLLFNRTRSAGAAAVDQSVDAAAIKVNELFKDIGDTDVTVVISGLVYSNNNGITQNVENYLPVFVVPKNKSRPVLPDETGGAGAATLIGAGDPAKGTAINENIIETMFPAQGLSLATGFNRVAYQYLKGNLDSSNKIYAGLINSYVNGPLSAVIMSSASPNAMQGIPDNGPVGSKAAEQVLYRSLARAYYRTYMSMADSSAKQHLYLDLIDVPAHMKETYRVHLSAVQSMLDAVIKRGEFLKDFIRNALNVSKGPKDADADTHVRIIDNILRAAQSLKGAAGQVLRELADEPVYLETYAGSIRDFQQRQNMLPVMPFSGLLAGSKLTTPALATNGTDDFKYAYGTRGILSGDMNRTVPMPGVEALLAIYNSSAGSSQIRSDEAKKFYALLLPIVQCIMCKSQWMRLFVDSRVAAVPNDVMVRNMSIRDVIDGAESTDQERIFEKLTAGMKSSREEPGQSDRAQMQMRNITDLNRMPINVHAIMRVAPLANIYNYEYTFDQMLSQMFTGSASGNISKLSKDASALAPSISGLVALQYMTVLPFRNVMKDEYIGQIAKIFKGLTGVGLGRPKFLSDQLYNKALFGEIYNSTSKIPEHGTDLNRNNTNLIYPKSSNNNTADAGSVAITADIKTRLTDAGHGRFNTALVRSLFFISNLQRILRARIMRDMSEYRSVLSRTNDIVNPMVTEYTIGQAQSFTGMSEQLDGGIF